MTQTETADAVWSQIRTALEKLFPADLFAMWFEDLVCVDFKDDQLRLQAASEFNAIWVENNYMDVLLQQATAILDKPIKITLITVSDTATAPTPLASNRRAETAALGPSQRTSPEGDFAAKRVHTGRAQINERNTFGSFVVGAGNQLAHAASIAVANAPGRAYNPLFLFGDTGLGKTHLMHAVAHQMYSQNSKARIAYVSTEKFTNEFIHAIRENKLTKFRKYYRNVDALLVDDIHFLSGKESTQEEFFHTFNDLFESGRQIFIASDRPANEIARLENRLVSRFQWGLVTDIQAPDFETRMAILGKKAAAMNIDLAPEVMQFLGERVSRNVRRMEGALTRIASYDALMDRKLDLQAVVRLLKDLLHEEVISQVTVEQIQNKITDYYKVRMSELIGRRRTANIVLPRQIAMYICRTLTSEPLKLIGDAFGGRDHGTVIHACKQIEHLMEQDPNIKRAVDYLIQQLAKTKNS